jgi:hypothetical protein
MAVTLGPSRWVKPQLTRLVEEVPVSSALTMSRY